MAVLLEDHSVTTGTRTARLGSNPPGQRLRGPAAMHFISRDTCSDSIAKLFGACFVGYRTSMERYVAKWGIAEMCLCESKYQGGGTAPICGRANFPEKVSRDMGYRSDSTALSPVVGPLRPYVRHWPG